MSRFCKMLGVTIAALLAVSGCKDAVPELIPVTAGVYTFSDGEVVSTWKYEGDNKLLYLLNDGIELMGTDIVGLERSVIELQDLEQPAEDNITAFYDRQGALFDVDAYLEQAYKAYTQTENGADFYTYHLSQETFVSASSEKIVYCTTSLSLPLDMRLYDDYCITHAFDKKTGELINGWNLFSGSKAEIKSALIGNDTTDPDVLSALYDAFKPEYVCFYPDRYEIRFPAALSSHLEQEETDTPYNKVISGPYTEKVLSVLQEWAVPNFAAGPF